ncbi:MAG TPA: gas vesicle protein [Actinocatenispora sp.]
MTEPLVRTEQVSLVDLLDRVLARGVVLTGDVTLSIAEVDLVRVSLNALLTSVRAEYTDER